MIGMISIVIAALLVLVVLAKAYVWLEEKEWRDTIKRYEERRKEEGRRGR